MDIKPTHWVYSLSETLKYQSRPFLSVLWAPKRTMQSDLFYMPNRRVANVGGCFGWAYIGLVISQLALDADEGAWRGLYILFSVVANESDLFNLYVVSIVLSYIFGICFLYLVSFITSGLAQVLGSDIPFTSLKHVIGLSLVPQATSYLLILFGFSLYRHVSDAVLPEFMQSLSFSILLLSTPILWAAYVQRCGFKCLIETQNKLGILLLVPFSLSFLLVLALMGVA